MTIAPMAVAVFYAGVREAAACDWKIRMTVNLHKMLGLANFDPKSRLLLATEHLRDEMKDVFRSLDLEDSDPRQRRLTDACNAWVKAATEMADSHANHVGRRVTQISDKAIIKMRKEVEVTEIAKWRDVNRVLRPLRLSLVLAVAMIGCISGFVAGLYYSAYTEASVVQSSRTAPPLPSHPLASKP